MRVVIFGWYDQNGGSTALHRAAYRGHEDVVECLLNHKADVNAKNQKGLTPLDFAKNSGHPKVLKIMITIPNQVQNTTYFAIQFPSLYPHLFA